MTQENSRIPAPAKYGISVAILILSVMASGGLVAVFKKPPEDKEAVDLMPLVSTTAASTFKGDLTIEVGGLVVPYREVEVSAEVSGRIESKSDSCRAGNFVKAGDPLISIDKTDINNTIRRLNAELTQANVMITELEKEIEGLKNTVAVANKDFELQKDELKRREDLGNALSQSEVQQARRNLYAAERALTELTNTKTLAEARMDRLQSGIELSQAQLEAAQNDLARTDIVAPFDGVIVSDLVEAGDFVQKGEDLLVLEDTSKAEVQCNLRLDQLDRILKFNPLDASSDTSANQDVYRLPPTDVVITAELGTEKAEWSGTLMRYDGIGVDQRTKTVPCSVVVDNPVTKCGTRDQALVRGYFVKVRMGLPVADHSDTNLLQIPAVAVQPGNYVWAVRNKKLERFSVKIIDRFTAKDKDNNDKEYVVIEIETELGVTDQSDDNVKRQKPIEAGDAIVTSPLTQPIPGVEVNPKPDDAIQSTSTDPPGGDDEPQVTSTKGDSSS